MNKKINRKDLYDKVWSTPMRKLAAEFGISDRGLTKICKRYNIPLPGIGYWAKLQWNKPVKQSPLPEPEKNDEIIISVVETSDEPIDEKQLAEADRIIASIKKQSEPTKVKVSLTKLHPLVEQTAKNLRSTKTKSDGILWPSSGSYWGVNVSKESLGRCLRIMDCLIKTLEKHGFKVSLSKDRRRSMSVMILGEEVRFIVRESYHLVERKPSEKDYSFGWKQYGHKPSGVLILRIENECYIKGFRKQWSDTEKTKLENRIDDLVIGLIKAAIKIRSSNLKRQMIKKEWEEKRMLERQRDLQRLEEEQKIANLNAEVNNWYESQKIRAYLETLRALFTKQYGNIESGSKADEYFKWAFGYVERLDPLASK